MSDLANRLAVVDIPSDLDPYVFIVGGQGPLEMLTRDELRQIRATRRELAERVPESEELPEGQIGFQVRGFDLRDAMSELGVLQVDLMLASDVELPVESVIGKPVMFAWACGTEQERAYRYYHGIVSELSETGGDFGATFYRAVVVPRAWRLTLKTRCRIFQKKSVPEIIKQVLQENNLLDGQDVQFQLSGTYDPRTYCVQYRESDFNFISRLMEEEGISYYFDHTEVKEVLNIVDARPGYPPCVPYDMIVVQTPERGEQDEEVQAAAQQVSDALDQMEHADELEERLRAFRFNHTVQSGKVRLRDYNFENSNKKPAGQAVGSCTNEPEVYDYPGRFCEDGRGRLLANIRMQELDSLTRVAHGHGNFRSLAAGKTFAIMDHPNPSYNRVYMCTAVSHSGTNENLLGADGQPVGMGGTTYENEFECVPDDAAYRPPRVTPKPVVIGVQTAKVVGPSGEEIYTDKFLRVKVQFHWDLEGQENENSSCWLRVVQPWADKGFGTVILPRIGTEVLVEFLEGDPDRPIANGVVYNDQHMPPFDLPGKKMQTGIKSNTTPGGGGSNEIRLDDSSAGEEIFIHAQKDQNNVVENDETTQIGHDRTEQVGNNETITIGVDRTESVGNNETISIGANRTENVGGNESITVALTRTRVVGVAESVTIGAAQSITVGASQTNTVGANRTSNIGANDKTSIGANNDTVIGGNQSTSVSGEKSTTVGGDYTIAAKKDLSAQADKNVLIDGGDQITIQSGKSRIQMKKNGDILIEGKDINIKASGNIVMKANKNILQN